MARRKDSKNLQVYFRLPHPVTGEPTRVRFSSGTTCRREFAKIVAQAKADFLHGTFNRDAYGTKAAVPGSLSFPDAAAYVFDRLWKHKPAADSYQFNIKTMVQWFGDRPCSSITTTDVVAYLDNEKQVKLNAFQTLKAKHTRLKKILTTVERMGMVPALGIDWDVCRPVNEGRGVFRHEFYFDEATEIQFVEAFLKRGRSDVADLFVFLIETGLRKGEALALRWSDVSWDDRSIIVRGLDTGAGKTASARRSVPLTGVAHELLKSKSPVEDKHVFQLTADSVKKVFESVRDQLGYQGREGVTMHACRHTCATRLAESGLVDVYQLKAWMGWASIAMADTYVNSGGRSLINLRNKLETMEGCGH